MPASLEQKIHFPVPEDWDKGTSGVSPHQKLQEFLESNGLWRTDFLYGCADSTFAEERKIKGQGFCESQKRGINGGLRLFQILDCRDNYCNEDFFKGKKVIVVYSGVDMEPVGPMLYLPMENSFPVTLVIPIHQDSLLPARGPQ